MIAIEEIGKKYSPEMALVILIGRAFFKTADTTLIEEHITKHPIDWQLFHRIISVHQLRPVIFKVLSAAPASIAPSFLDKLKRSCMVIASGNLLKLEELSSLHRQFSDAGIHNIPYKGVVLSDLLYGDFITRETADIDFLINTHDFPGAVQVLMRNSFQPGYYFNPAFGEVLLQSESEMIFKKEAPAGIVKVELHWAVAHRMLDVPLSLSQLFANAGQADVAGRMLTRMQLNDHLLVLLAHHGVNDMWRTLRHIIDLSAVMQQYGYLFDSVNFRLALEQYKIKKSTAIGLHLAHELLGAPLPAGVEKPGGYDEVLHNLLSFPIGKRVKLSYANMVRQFQLRDSLLDKLRLMVLYIRAGLTPNMRDVATLPLPPRLSGLYYILKPFLFLARKKN